MAELWKLPVIYVIENNQYAMGTAVGRSTAEVHLYKHGASNNIPGEPVDGMDVEAVYAAGQKAVQWAREGKGPYILEMKTYRYRGHSMSDPAKYRTREEVQQMREKHDPIDTFGARLVRSGAVREDDLKAIDRELRQIINRAAEFATESPEPAPEDLYTDVWK